MASICAFGIGAEAANRSCFGNLLTDGQRSDLNRFGNMTTAQGLINRIYWKEYDLTVPGLFGRLTLSSSLFRKVVSEESNWAVAIISRSEQERVLKLFVDRLNQVYSGESLRAMQSASLLEELKWRGYKTEQTDGYEALRILSRRNLEREMQELGLNNQPSAESMALAQSVQFYSMHNGTRKLRAMPLLSSHTLEDLGTTGGCNTAEYNKCILRSDRNTFFYFHAMAAKNNMVPVGSKYGFESIFLDWEYARSHAWVSPYIMYYEDQGAVIGRALGEDAKEEWVKNEKGLWTADFTLKDGEVLRGRLSALHRLDFTLPDFETLVRAAIADELDSLKAKDFPSYEHAIFVLSEDSGQSWDFLFELIKRRLGFKPEVKVPVGVPLTKYFQL